jgi:hypothetical protein
MTLMNIRDYEFLIVKESYLKGVLVEIYVDVAELWASAIEPFRMNRKCMYLHRLEYYR